MRTALKFHRRRIPLKVVAEYGEYGPRAVAPARNGGSSVPRMRNGLPCESSRCVPATRKGPDATGVTFHGAAALRVPAGAAPQWNTTVTAKSQGPTCTLEVYQRRCNRTLRASSGCFFAISRRLNPYSRRSSALAAMGNDGWRSFGHIGARRADAAGYALQDRKHGRARGICSERLGLRSEGEESALGLGTRGGLRAGVSGQRSHRPRLHCGVTPVRQLLNAEQLAVLADGWDVTPVGELLNAARPAVLAGGCDVTPVRQLLNAEQLAVLAGGWDVTPVGELLNAARLAVLARGCDVTPVGELLNAARLAALAGWLWSDSGSAVAECRAARGAGGVAVERLRLGSC